MSEITEVKTTNAPKPLPVFSQAVKANGMVFCSGNIGLDKDTWTLVEGGIKAQTVSQSFRDPPRGFSLQDIAHVTTPPSYPRLSDSPTRPGANPQEYQGRAGGRGVGSQPHREAERVPEIVRRFQRHERGVHHALWGSEAGE